MEFEGTVLQPNFREKEKRYRATIAERDASIESLMTKISVLAEEATKLKLEIKDLKEENIKTKHRFRNFKAKVTVREQPDADSRSHDDV